MLVFDKKTKIIKIQLLHNSFFKTFTTIKVSFESLKPCNIENTRFVIYKVLLDINLQW